MSPKRETLEPTLALPGDILGERESVLIYGDSGKGKSFTAFTAPEPIWALTPGGTNELKTAFSPTFVEKHGRKEIYVTSVVEDRKKGQMVDNPSGYDRCCDAVDDFLEWNVREGIGIQTIVVDNATVLEEYMMNKAIMAEYSLASSQAKTVLAHERKYGIRRPHDSTYGAAQSFMDRWVNWLKELPFHLVFVAHAYEVTRASGSGRDREVVSVSPLFVGKQRISIPNSFDNVWYAKTSGGGRGVQFRVQTVGDDTVLAKTRVGGVLHHSNETDPNLTEIIDKFAQYGRDITNEEAE